MTWLLGFVAFLLFSLPLLWHRDFMSLLLLMQWSPSYSLCFWVHLIHCAYSYQTICCCGCSVARSCLTLCDLVDGSMPDFLSFTISQSLLRFMSTESVCYLTFSSSAALFSFCLQSLPASGSFSTYCIYNATPLFKNLDSAYGIEARLPHLTFGLCMIWFHLTYQSFCWNFCPTISYYTPD